MTIYWEFLLYNNWLPSKNFMKWLYSQKTGKANACLPYHWLRPCSINFTYYNSFIDELQDKNKSQVFANVHVIQNTQYNCKYNCYNPVKDISYWLEYFLSKPFRTGAWRTTFATIKWSTLFLVCFSWLLNHMVYLRLRKKIFVLVTW